MLRMKKKSENERNENFFHFFQNAALNLELVLVQFLHYTRALGPHLDSMDEASFPSLTSIVNEIEMILLVM